VSQDLIPSRFRFVPWLDFDSTWSDEDLYARFDLTNKEIAYIERTVSPRNFIDSARSAIPETHLPGGRKFGITEEEASEDSDDD
jgi:site-specific DNA-methyltransferase (adenine-specific)